MGQIKINTSQDPKDYEHLVKNRCRGEDCTRPTRNETSNLTALEHYEKYGNWCISCHSRSKWTRNRKATLGRRNYIEANNWIVTLLRGE